MLLCVEMAPEDGAAFGIALYGEFHRDHHVEDLLRRDEDWGGAEDGVADIGIEITPITDRWDSTRGGVTIFHKCEFAPIFLFLESPVVACGYMAGAQGELKGIEIAFEITAVLREEDDTRARRGRKHRGAKKRARVLRIVQKHVEGIVSGETGAFDANVGNDRFRRAEQGEGLIEEVRGKVEEDAAARAGLFAPSAKFWRGTIAIVGGFETSDAAEFARVDDPSQTLEVGVEAAVVINRENEILAAG